MEFNRWENNNNMGIGGEMSKMFSRMINKLLCCGGILGGIAAALLLIVGPVAALITHVVYCFTAKAYVLLIAGIIAFPIGIFHGIGLWFGWW